MQGYSGTEIFESRDIDLFKYATRLVDKIPEDFLPAGEELRCHELARAVGSLLSIPFVDGRFGSVEHSWLWTRQSERPVILDVYTVARLPMVQLIDYCAWQVRASDFYLISPFPRTDIKTAVIDSLLDFWSRAGF
jgi:hypothetical protein